MARSSFEKFGTVALEKIGGTGIEIAGILEIFNGLFPLSFLKLLVGAGAVWAGDHIARD